MNTREEVYLPLGDLVRRERKLRIVGLGYRINAYSGPDPKKEPTAVIWDNHKLFLRVMEGKEQHGGMMWHHLSFSHRFRMPTWDEFSMAKRQFMGEDIEAYAVHPPASRYVNIANVLHWWACLDKPDGVLPDFRVLINGQVGI